jgi:membrane-associated phospholipid phosphatase
VRRLFLKEHRRVAGWWFLALGGMVIHATLRGWMKDLGAPVRADGLELGLFGTLPTLWLQHHLLGHARSFFDWATVVVHASWFVVPWLAGLLVTLRRRERIGSFFIAWLVLWAVVLPVFALTPMQPPWMANHDVTRVVATKLGSDVRDPNPFAAMPSMHVALPAVIAFWFIRERWFAPGTVMILYSALVGFEVVFSGEHYVTDVIAGFLVAAAVAFAPALIDATRRARTQRAARPARLRERPITSVREVGDSGQSLIEFAMLMPVVAVFIGIIVVMGLLLNTRSSLQQAMREGARQAAVGATLSNVQDLAAGNAPDALTPADVRLCYPDGSGQVGDSVRAYIFKDGAAGYLYTLVSTGGLLKALGANLNVRISPQATARLEKSVSAAEVAAAGPCPS